MQRTDLFCGVCRKLASGICGLQSAFFICPYVHLIKIGSIDMVKLYHIDGCQHTNMKNNKQNFITVRNKADHRSWQETGVPKDTLSFAKARATRIICTYLNTSK